MFQREEKEKKSKTKVRSKKKVLKNKKPVKDLMVNNKKKKKDNSNDFNLKEVVIIVVIACTIASFCTGFIMYFKYRNSNAITYHKLDKDDKLNEFVNIYSEIVDNYYDEVDRNSILDAAIKAMVGNLDDVYSSYLTEEEAEALNDKLSGQYTGIGIQVLENVVIKVFDDSPAKKAGIEVNDIVKNVNGKEITKDNFSNITEEIKNSEDDTIKMIVERDGEDISFELKRAVLDLPAISYQMSLEDGKKIGYIYIESFSSTLTRQVRNALETMEDEGMEALIIDVRGNTGGYLTAATGVSSLFIEKGRVLYSLESKNGVTKYFDETDEHRDYEIVVLIDGGTASSSEILAGALKDSYGATLIGKTSYGKGKVQTKKDLSNGTIVKYTNSRWLRPNGDCVDEKGITPDYEVEIEVSKDGETYIDTQLNKAVEILTKD